LFGGPSGTIQLNQPLGLDGDAIGFQLNVTGIGAFAITGSKNLTLTGAVTRPYVSVTNGSSLSIQTNVSGPQGFIKLGDGTLTLTGAGTYAGDTDVWEGSLFLNHTAAQNAAIPSGTTLKVGDGTGAAATAEVRLLTPAQIDKTVGLIIATDGRLNLNGFQEEVGDVTLNGGRIDTLGGDLRVKSVLANDFSSITATNQAGGGGTFTLIGGTNVPINVAAGKALSINAQIIGTGGLVKKGLGLLRYDSDQLVAKNTYTGVTTIEDGALILNNKTTDGAFAGDLVIGDGTGAQASAAVYLEQSQEIPNGSHITIKSEGQLNLDGRADTVGALTLATGGTVVTGAETLHLAGDVTITAGAATSALFTGQLDLGPGTRTLTVADGPPGSDFVLNGTISGGDLVKDGPGTIEIKGAANSPNTFGTTTVKTGTLLLNDDGINEAIQGTLIIGDGLGAAETAVVRLLQSGEIADAKSLAVLADGWLDLNTHGDRVGGLVIAGGKVSAGGGNGTLVVAGDLTSSAANSGGVIYGHLGLDNLTRTISVTDGPAPLDLLIDAVIPNGGLIKTGDGRLVLNGANTYPGPTTINAGILEIDGVQPASSIALNGGTLAGTGAVGIVTATGGTINPGSYGAGAALTTQSLILGPATFAPDLAGPAAFDRLQVTGTVNLSGGTLAPNLTFGSTAGTTFRIIDNDGSDPVVGTFAGLAEGATVTLNGRPFQISYTGGDGNDVVLVDKGGAATGLVGAAEFAAGADAGGGAVTFFNKDGTTRFTVTPFGGFAGGVRTAAGDFTGDGVADLVVGTGPGSPTHVAIYDGVSQAVIYSTDPFEAAFTGGVFVAAGDITGDGKADLVITPDQGGGPRCRVFRGGDFQQLADFYGIDDPNFRGGARAAVADVTGDGKGDLLVAAGFGGGPRLAAFNGSLLGPTGGPKLFGDFFVFEQTLRNGIYIAGGDLNGDGFADVIAGGGPGGGPRVYALSGKDLVQPGTQTQLANFFAGDPDSRGGVRLAVKNLDGDGKADLVVGAGAAAGSRVNSYLGASITANNSPSKSLDFDAFPGFAGGVFVG
jgi:autotransporter-associated beta strand protein